MTDEVKILREGLDKLATMGTAEAIGRVWVNKVARETIAKADASIKLCPTCKNDDPIHWDYRGDDRWNPCPECKGTGMAKADLAKGDGPVFELNQDEVTDEGQAIKSGILLWLGDPDVERKDPLAGDFEELHGSIMFFLKTVIERTKEEAMKLEVERLAKALLFDNYFGADDVWDSIGDSVREDCRKRAKVMIEFMGGHK
jgi:hypothetical protein